MSAIIIGIEEQTLCAADQRRLRATNCAGAILFTRNFSSYDQLRTLIEDIRACKPDALVCVDHEGGRVQRFMDGFTRIPAMATFGKIFSERPVLALQLAHACGVIIAYELASLDIDFSFTPVLDLQDSASSVIGERALSAHPAEVSILASALRKGLADMGMVAVGKHYPGHGRVCGDSHHVLPHDTRSECEREADLAPFLTQIHDGIEALMPAHIVYPESDGLPAGFSSLMLQRLRDYGFDGAIISDDLDMAGADIIGDGPAKVQKALTAGADLTLICNNFVAIDAALAANYDQPQAKHSQTRIAALRHRFQPSNDALQRYNHAKALFNTHYLTLFSHQERSDG
ncbi:beta-N-acetylhexosaminidase [Suttonella sp. R2A3]|uniref:beta-N-acetylhexosaminidase n=1 Tax=Suttonella sp. R2A3 TaxID=2908648 RepID=UPI001F24ABA6|nr:beta-N-acetylhexosaminidase [Suttonella sp. R2A3]UJF24961.1 beta-N-acetylhexosaminidase [Suttonella sp. R2A3]